MKDLSLTQEYFICAVNDRGKLSNLNLDRTVCFIASGVLELQLAGCIYVENAGKLPAAMAGKRIRVTDALPEEKAYLRPFYDYLNQEKPVKVEKIVEDYGYAFSEKRTNALVASVGESLVQDGLAQAGKTGPLGGVKSYLPSKEALNRVIDLVRSELLEEGEVTEDIAALVILLEKSGVIREYFSRHEQKEMKEKLSVLVKSPEGKLVKEMVEDVQNMLAAMAVLLTVYS